MKNFLKPILSVRFNQEKEVSLCIPNRKGLNIRCCSLTHLPSSGEGQRSYHRLSLLISMEAGGFPGLTWQQLPGPGTSGDLPLALFLSL